MSAVFKFVASDQAGPKRLQTSKACEYCRRRKKRCVHGDAIPASPARRANSDGISVPGKFVDEGNLSVRDQEGASQHDEIHGSLNTSSHATHNSRFIGDLNPEGIFLAATTPNATRGISSDESIGVW